MSQVSMKIDKMFDKQAAEQQCLCRLNDKWKRNCKNLGMIEKQFKYRKTLIKRDQNVKCKVKMIERCFDCDKFATGEWMKSFVFACDRAIKANCFKLKPKRSKEKNVSRSGRRMAERTQSNEMKKERVTSKRTWHYFAIMSRKRRARKLTYILKWQFWTKTFMDQCAISRALSCKQSGRDAFELKMMMKTTGSIIRIREQDWYLKEKGVKGWKKGASKKSLTKAMAAAARDQFEAPLAT